jgi:hypothetical protein
MTSVATMAVMAAAVARTAAAALTLGDDCSGCSVGEAESSKGGTVLHLQALSGGVGRGAVDEPTEEGTGEGGGWDCGCPCGFHGGGRRLPSPSSTLSSPTLTTTMTTLRMATTTWAWSQGGERDDKQMGFRGGREEEKGNGGPFGGTGGWGVVVVNLRRCCFVLWSEYKCIHRN